MTKQLNELFDNFTKMSSHEQLEKIREIRHSRSIERPAVAKRRQKKETKKRAKQASKASDLIKQLTPEQRAELIKKLKGEA